MRTTLLTGLLALLLVVGCSGDDRPEPEEAVATTAPPRSSTTALPATTVVGDEEEAGEEEEPELPEAEDAVLDALEEQFEPQGVKDTRGAPGVPVTVRMEDGFTVQDAGPACAAVRSAGFPDVEVDVDGVLSPCP